MINSQAREYATVLYELGLDKKQVVLIFDSLSKVLENKEISGFFNHPIINKDEKKKIKTICSTNDVCFINSYVSR